MAKWHGARGWVGPDRKNGTADDVGYHYFIRKSGQIEKGRNEDQIGAHVKGKNKHSIGICLHGLKEDKFTKEQFESAAKLISGLLQRYGLTKKDIYGHNKFSNKKCPVYDINEVTKRILNV